ncbi:hypothetical protein NP233_g5662 [Leucocoprinus birnbaumii]|uniref:Uncharacterized protein n=1 Tax=Leucocoprinus birnbaumii TaxID=56174 RepID=A0AAD5VVY2_9AGAR|nr:hypothetical protein NP233_g5662 [Leucocoprinus birnbaumii]
MVNSTLPNPDVYLNHLSPDLASQLENTRNVYLVFLGIAIWDFLIYFLDDVKILIYSPITVTMICYMTTRVLAVAYMLILVVSQTRPIADCSALEIGMGVVCISTLIATSFLFLRRLHAVFFDQRTVRWLFNFLWLGASVMTVLLPMGVVAEHIDGTEYCVVQQIHSYAAISEFLLAAFDTSVFLAISYKLICCHAEVKISNVGTWKAFFNGNLPPISRALLRGCQHYYLTRIRRIASATTIGAGILLCLPNVPITYRPLLTFTDHVIAASMACRVYRNLRAQSINEAHSPGSGVFRGGSDQRDSRRYTRDSQKFPLVYESSRGRESPFPTTFGISSTGSASSIVILPLSIHDVVGAKPQ